MFFFGLKVLFLLLKENREKGIEKRELSRESWTTFDVPLNCHSVQGGAPPPSMAAILTAPESSFS
jgi:hypothetical protein